MSTWLGAGLGFGFGFGLGFGLGLGLGFKEHVDLGPSRAQRRQLLVGLVAAHRDGDPPRVAERARLTLAQHELLLEVRVRARVRAR
eukprot:scaffold67855_cov49-Phaeocystis_antarctica.AAC.1